jgi:hypothetical protein
MKEIPEIKIAVGDIELVRFDTESAHALASVAARNSLMLGQAAAGSILNKMLLRNQSEAALSS